MFNDSANPACVKVYLTKLHRLLLTAVRVLGYNRLRDEIGHDCKFYLTKTANLKLVQYLLNI